MFLLSQISAASNLEPLRKSEIVDLVLKGNPICDRLRDESVYIRYAFQYKQSSLLTQTFYDFHFSGAYG